MRAAGTVAVNITERVMFGNRDDLFYFDLHKVSKLILIVLFDPLCNQRCEFVIR